MAGIGSPDIGDTGAVRLESGRYQLLGDAGRVYVTPPRHGAANPPWLSARQPGTVPHRPRRARQPMRSLVKSDSDTRSRKTRWGAAASLRSSPW